MPCSRCARCGSPTHSISCSGPFFIFGWGPFPELGVTGAAVATNIGRGVGVLYQLWHLAGHNSRVRVRLQHFRPAFDVMKGIVTTSGNGILQLLISTTSWVGLFKILSMFGSAALAGYTIAIRIVMFALMPAWGLANAGATLVGQNLGAQQPDRAEAAVRIATRFNVIFLAIVGVFFVIFAYPLMRLFTNDPETLTYGARALVDHQPGVPAVRGRHVPGVGVQRRRGHVDADAPEFLLLLARTGSARLDPCGRRWPGPDGRVHLDTDLVLGAGAMERRALQARQVETAEGVTYGPGCGKALAGTSIQIARASATSLPVAE